MDSRSRERGNCSPDGARSAKSRESTPAFRSAPCGLRVYKLSRQVRRGAQVAQARQAIERLQLPEQRRRALLAQLRVGAVVELRRQLIARKRLFPVPARELDVGARQAPPIGKLHLDPVCSGEDRIVL